MSYEEEDTCLSYEEEDTCLSYEEISALADCYALPVVASHSLTFHVITIP